MTLTTLLIGVIGLGAGLVLGYYARQSILRRRAGTLEKKFQAKKAKKLKSNPKK